MWHPWLSFLIWRLTVHDIFRKAFLYPERKKQLLQWASVSLSLIFLPMVYASVMSLVQKIQGNNEKKSEKYQFKQVRYTKIYNNFYKMRNTMHSESTAFQNTKKTFFGGTEIRTRASLLARRICRRLRPLGHANMLRSWAIILFLIHADLH